jgi:hypothetical protein
VLIGPGGPSIAARGELGAARISVGGALAYAALGTLAEAARPILSGGEVSYGPLARTGREAVDAAFG